MVLDAAILNCTFIQERDIQEKGLVGVHISHFIFLQMKSCKHTLQQVSQSLGPQRDWSFGFVVGDGEILHAQLLCHFGLCAVVYQRTAEKLRTNKEGVTLSYPPVGNVLKV